MTFPASLIRAASFALIIFANGLVEKLRSKHSGKSQWQEAESDMDADPAVNDYIAGESIDKDGRQPCDQNHDRPDPPGTAGNLGRI